MSRHHGQPDSEGFGYLGIKACGCFGFLCVDDPEYAESIAEDVRWIVANGGKVERGAVPWCRERARDLRWGCAICKPGEVEGDAA